MPAALAVEAQVPADVVRVADLRFQWPGQGRFALAVRSFSLGRHEKLLLLGPSGSGKSTWLSLLCGILAPDQGRIEVCGTDLTRLTASARDAFRAEHIGVIFQMFNLLPYGSVMGNVTLPLSFASARRARVAAAGGAEAEALRLLLRLGLPAELAHGRSVADLSVGQQQRVAAARALIGAPELIVADEPTSALDRDRQADFLDLMFEQLEAAGSALIMVSHEETFAARFDRTVRLEDIIAPGESAGP